MHKDIAEILLSQEEIHAKVVELGKQISRDYQDKNLLLLGVLKGAVLFIIDLARAIDLLVDIDYMSISSYSTKTHSSGVVRILKKRDPLSVRVCTLLNKERKRDVEVELAYEGFTIPILFVVGYGMDYAQLYRNLPYIGILKPEAYSNGTERPETQHKHPVEGKDPV